MLLRRAGTARLWRQWPLAAASPAASVRAAASTPLLPLSTGRPRLVVVGTGWGAASLLRHINPALYDLTVVSERNHMVFTPLLSSVTVGTLSPSSVAVHIADIQPALKQGAHPANAVLTATVLNVLPERRAVECAAADGLRFYVEYDALVVAAGSQGSTFNIPGVEEHALPLRDVRHAEAIRARLIRSIALAAAPGRPPDEVRRLLSLVCVGGGPTGVEVAGEISNFVRRDLARYYPERSRRFSITLVEARELLSSFDASLREYAASSLTKRGVALRKGVVARVTERGVELRDGEFLPAATVVWSTGVGPTPLTLALPFSKTPIGRLAVDGQLRVLREPPLSEGEAAAGAAPPLREGDRPPPPQAATSILAVGDEASQPRPSRLVPVPGIYALGDCCADVDRPLPALAQVAEQQGRFLARRLNEALTGAATPRGRRGEEDEEAFVYRHLGSMATTGGLSAILQVELPGRRRGAAGGGGGGGGSGSGGGGLDAWLPKQLRFRGLFSWLAWRSAYATRLGSLRKRASVLFDWTQTMLFGRDLSQW